MFLNILMALGAAASVAGTVSSVRAQNRASKLSERQEAVQTQFQRRRAIREMQIARARGLASAAGGGAGFGSGAIGGIGALSSQLGADMGFSSQMSGLSSQINAANRQANTMGGLAQLGGAAFGFAQSRGATFPSLGGQAPTAAPTPSIQSAYTPYTGVRPQARPFTSVNDRGPGFR